MPIWEFNSLQSRLLMMLSVRRRRSEEMKTLALIAASCGLKQEAMDCYLQMLDLNNPERISEKETFAEDSMTKFTALKNKMKMGKGL